MSLDLIKQYLVGIGFDVDSNSLNNAEKSINSADKTIKNFNDNSKKGFSDTNSSLKDLFQLLMSSSGTIGKLFPELRTPFKGLIGDIVLIKKLYSDLTKQKETPKADSKTEPPKTQPKQESQFTPKKTNNNPVSKGLSTIPKNNTELLDTSKSLVGGILDAKDASKGLADEGGKAFKLFSVEALGSIAAVVVGVAAFALATKKLIDSLNDLAKQDIEYEKLSRQLWTTKENAKEIDMALKTMGATMQDLWLSPTLLKQFTQLRKDSAALKLPKEYTDNLKVIQGIGLEFKRLQQLGTLAFQWIGNYILKYAAGPLNEIKQSMHGLNDWLIKSIPGIAKAIGSIIGIIVRVVLIIGEIIAFLWKITSPIVAIFKLIDEIPGPMKKIIEIIGIIAALIIAGPIGAVIALIAVLDDLFTYFKGGKSVIGNFFNKIGRAHV